MEQFKDHILMREALNNGLHANNRVQEISVANNPILCRHRVVSGPLINVGTYKTVIILLREREKEKKN